MIELDWLPPKCEDWSARLRAITAAPDPAARWTECVALSRYRIDFLETAKLDREMQRLHVSGLLQPDAARPSLRLALLASSTVQHLIPGLRVGAVRHGVELVLHEGDYGQYRQELMDRKSSLHAFRPDAVLLALDSFHLAEGGSTEASLELLRDCWRQIRDMGAIAIQQALLPVHPRLMGNNEHAMADSPAAVVSAVNTALRHQPGVMLLAVDAAAAADGLTRWHDPALWHRAKQEIASDAPRRCTAIWSAACSRPGRGARCKCLVLDLDNTLWGGVIGDDGLEGIVLGQGSRAGRGLRRVPATTRASLRGAASSSRSARRTTRRTRWSRSTSTPRWCCERSDIACFVANWTDKASNIRAIAERAEHRPRRAGLRRRQPVRAQPGARRNCRWSRCPSCRTTRPTTRRPSPMPAISRRCRLTEEDRERTGQYQGNPARDALEGVGHRPRRPICAGWRCS